LQNLGERMEIGSKIKNLRLQLGLTQEELADRCELTKGFISQVENDNNSLSITSLLDILNALGITPAQFFSEDKQDQIIFGENEFIEKKTDSYTINWLIPNSQKNEMEPIRVDLQPHSSMEEDIPHDGEEFGYVLNGEIVLKIGNNKSKVKKGQAFYFTSAKPHNIENNSDKVATFIWVSSPPTF